MCVCALALISSLGIIDVHKNNIPSILCAIRQEIECFRFRRERFTFLGDLAAHRVLIWPILVELAEDFGAGVSVAYFILFFMY